MRLEVMVAIIASTASLVGSVVGAGTAYIADERQRDEDADRELAGARAMGMLEAYRFQAVDEELKTMDELGVYTSIGGEDRPGVRGNDIAAVVARLTRAQSAALAEARVCVARYDAAVAGTRQGARVDRFFRLQIPGYRLCVRRGMRALNPLLDTPPLDS